MSGYPFTSSFDKPPARSRCEPSATAPPLRITPTGTAGCAAGLKTLELYERLGVVDQAAHLGRVASDIMGQWEARYPIVRQVRSNGLLMGVSFQSPNQEEEDGWYAREIRSQMLDRGVWAISDGEVNLRMYPSLIMAEDVLREGLGLMEDALAHVCQHGLSVGNAPRMPTGV